MTTSPALELPSPDQIGRRAMFALQLIDPITRRFAGAEMAVTLPGFRPPLTTADGHLVWTDIDPPAERDVTVKGVSRRGIFAPFSLTYTIPKRESGVTATDLVKAHTLEPTGLYEPPPAVLAVAGMLVDDATVRAGVADASIGIQLRHATDPAPLTAVRDAVTDTRGGFVVVMGDLGTETPMTAPPPARDGALVGWLRIVRGGTIRFSPLLQPLVNNRLLRMPAPLVWADLAQAAPP